MNRISELRKKAGLTQRAFGDLLGVSQQTISKYENADVNVPGDMLAKMAKFFKAPIEYILREDEQEELKENDAKKEIMEIYRNLDQYNRNTWVILGKRLLGGQKQDFDL